MTLVRGLTALLLGLTGALLLVSTAAADTHDEEFLYEIYPGLRPPSEPDDLILTGGWHGVQYPESALDIVFDGATNLDDPVYAAIRTVQPGSGITAQIGDRTNGVSEAAGCRQVEVEFLKDGEQIGSITYKHVFPVASLASATLVPVPVPLAQRAGQLAPPMHIGGISERLQVGGDGSDGAKCPSGGYHLHQEASDWRGLPQQYRNINHSLSGPAAMDVRLRFGFFTVGGGLAARPFCSDTWLIAIQNSAMAPEPTPIANCDPPSTQEGPNLTDAVGAAKAIEVTWTEPRTAWNEVGVGFDMNGYAVTGYEYQVYAGPDSPPSWTGLWQPVDVTVGENQEHSAVLRDLHSGTEYAVRLRAVNDRGNGKGGPSNVRLASTLPGSGPTVTIAPREGVTSVTEGTPARFTLTRTGSTAAELRVKVEVDEEENRNMMSGEKPRTETVRIAPGATDGVLSVATVPDTTDEPDSTITATIQAGIGYAPGDPASAEVEVEDDDPDPSAVPVIGSFGLNDDDKLAVEFTWTGSDPDYLKWTLGRAADLFSSFTEVESVTTTAAQVAAQVAASETPSVTFTQQAPGWYEVRGRVCRPPDDETSQPVCTTDAVVGGTFPLLHPPSSPRSTGKTATSITVAFEEPAISSGYGFQGRVGATGAPEPIDVGSGSRSTTGLLSFSHTFDGLSPGTSYTFYVRSTGPDGGLSIWKSLSATTLPDTSLSALSLSGVTLTPTFAAGTLTYTGSASSSLTQTTVTATATDSTASVAIGPGDDNTSTTGHQVNLTEGATTTITVTVTSADASASSAYTVAVTRRSPPRPPPPPVLTLRASVQPTTCLTGGEVTISWEVRNARGAVSVSVVGHFVDRSRETGRFVNVPCMDEAGEQSAALVAVDHGPPLQRASATVRWRVNARSGGDCLSDNAVNTFAFWRSDCASTTAATLLGALRGGGACGIWLWQDPDWVGYSVTSDGTLVADSENFMIAAGNVLWIGGCDLSRGSATGPPGPPPNLPKS